MDSLSNNKKVFVGISGGVDSAVSAALLKQAGYDVVGVYIRSWQPDFVTCTWPEERRDAIRVCAYLDIPYLDFNAEEIYKTKVADYMIEEYRAGRTPNPDVMCNREIKFGVFWEFAKAHGADFIATGHYARIENKANNFQLLTGVDPAKDQSYFLWTLTQDDLEHTLFPIGHLNKTAVRKLAEKFGLPNANKKDSQGICFLGAIDMKEFLSHYIPLQRGKVLNKEGEEIGYHDGALFFTLGERHGFIITKKSANDARLYVVSKNIQENTVTVSASNSKETKNSRNENKTIHLKDSNWITGGPITNKIYTAQIRYHGEFLNTTIENIFSDGAEVIFSKPVLVSPGQSVVFYDREVCIGGGIVK